VAKKKNIERNEEDEERKPNGKKSEESLRGKAGTPYSQRNGPGSRVKKRGGDKTGIEEKKGGSQATGPD